LLLRITKILIILKNNKLIGSVLRLITDGGFCYLESLNISLIRKKEGGFEILWTK
jgi:hypothetical protein